MSFSRRDFIKVSGTLAVGSVFDVNRAFPAGLQISNTIKVGLIGCGGRGVGAAVQALRADPQVVITAIGDIFEDRTAVALHALKQVDEGRTQIDADVYLGFDAYQKVIDSDVDVVILASPPYFRPQHVTAAVSAGKHVFCEKPFAVDIPGVRQVIDAVRVAREKNIAFASGFCFRYDFRKRALFDKILNRDLGEILAVSSYRFGGELPSVDRQESWSDLAFQLKNWHYYNWLSGDMLVEQTIHSIDMMLWAMGGRLPYKVIGTGGRQVRVAEKYGNIYDHFAVEFEFRNGVRGFHFGRQQPGAAYRNTVNVVGSSSRADLSVGTKYVITGEHNWEYDGPTNNMYQTQHDELFASIRSGRPINDGEWAANSNILAILCTMAGYSGQEIDWDEAMKSNLSLGPAVETLDWDTVYETPPVPMPGMTKVL